MATNRIYIQVDFQQAGAVQNVNQLNRAIASIGPTTQKASQQASQGVTSLSMSVKQAQQTFSGISGAIAGLGIYNLGKQVLQATADIDTLRRGLNLWEGDTAKANQRFNQFVELSKKAGVSLEPAINAYNRLRGAGQGAEEAIELVEGFGKALGQMGKSGPELSGALEQVTQSIAKQGRVMREDLKFVQQYVPQVTKIMRERFKTADTEELAKQGYEATVFWKEIAIEMNRLQEAAPGVQKAMDNFWTQMRLGMEAVGQSMVTTLQPHLDEFLKTIQELVKWWNELDPGTRELAIKLTALGVAFGGIATAIYGIITAVVALNAALLANPITLAALGITAGGVAIGLSFREQKQRLEILAEEEATAARTQKILAHIAGGTTLKQLQEMTEKGERRFTDEQIRRALGGGRTIGGFAFEPTAEQAALRVERPLPKPTKPGEDAGAKAAALSLKKWIESVRQQTGEALDDAIADRQKELAKFLPADQQLAQELAALTAQRQKEWKDLITRVGPTGEEQKIPAKQQAELAVTFAKETAVRVGIIQDQHRQKILEKNKEFLQDYGKAVLEEETRLFERRWEFRLRAWEQEKELLQRTQDERLQQEMRGIEARRDAELEALEQLDDYTLQQKLEIAERRLDIEQKYTDQAMQMQLMLLAVDKERELAQLRIQASIAKMLDSPEYKQAVAAIEEYYKVRQQGVESDAQAKREANRVKTIGDQSKMIRSELEKTFNRFQDLADGVFDALLDKSKSVWQSMADFWKQAWLTAIKAVFSRVIASGLMRLFGMPVPAGAGGGGGFPGIPGGGGAGGAGGGWRGMLGSVFGLGGLGGLGGGGGGGWGGWPGTPPFIPGQAPTAAAGLTAGAGGGAGGGGGFLGMLGLGGGQGGGFMGMLRGLGGLGRGGLDPLGNKLGSIPGAAGSKAAGYGGAAGGAMLLGGATLAMLGLQRGGWSGLGMTTAGGALIGLKFGGPWGAAIGAGIGFGAGMIRMMFKSGEEKAKKKIQEVYGVSITSKDILKQIMQIAKDQFGGDLNVAVYSPAVREIVQMYTLATGQSAKGMPRPMYGVNMAQSGGQLAVQPVYSGGNIVANPYTGATTAQWNQGIYVQLNPDQANSLLEGRVVNVMKDNPQAVSDAATDAATTGYNRQAGRQASQEPLTTLA